MDPNHGVREANNANCLEPITFAVLKFEVRDTRFMGECQTLELVGQLIAGIGTPAFPCGLRRTLNALAPIDSFVVLTYHIEDNPDVLHDELYAEERGVFYDRYVNGAYQLSPFYQTSLNSAEPLFCSIADIAPDDFYCSEYWRDYYAPAGIVDEVGYLVPAGARDTLLISVGRVGINDELSEFEIARLREFLPIVDAVVRRHWLLDGDGPCQVPFRPAIQRHLTKTFETFGSEMLTKREQEVATLILKGNSSKSTARILDISPGTERVHRRNIYDKLGVSSQGELCSLFLDSLTEG